MGSGKGWRYLRYLVIFCGAGWAGAAAAYEMWDAMAFWFIYIAFVALSGYISDRERK